MLSDHNDKKKQRRLLAGFAGVMLIIVMGSIVFWVNFDGSRATALPAHRGTAIAATVSPTPTVQVTPQVLFFDYFIDTKKGWAVGDVAGYTRTNANGQLTLSCTNHKPLIESLPTSTTFTDFSLTTTFTLLQADQNDSIGLYLHGDSNLDHDYRIDIFGDSTYAISKESLDESNSQVQTTLIGPAHTPELKPTGEENTLTVMMKGSTLVLMLNGVVVKSITDTDYTHGQIALFVNHG